jgi:uncharacterized protein (TIGR04255 family)
MSGKDLKYKPLVEAILEFRWVLVSSPTSPGANTLIDPHYRLLLGRFSEKVQKDYPFHEPLPTSQIPDGMVPYIVQHRFRVSNSNWPLIQIGPGIVTINDTVGYKWSDFHKYCEGAIKMLIDSYPAPGDFKISDLTLRYINALPFDFNTNNIIDFLKDKMKINITLPDNLFEDSLIKNKPTALNWQASFFNSELNATVTIHLTTVQKNNEPSFLWETFVKSTGESIPDLISRIPQWIESAHNISDSWFFKLIEGDLERKFSDG